MITEREQSYVRGSGSPALLKYTIGEALQLAAARWPESEALVSVHQSIRLTWRELAERVDSFARGLLALGLAPRDRLGIWAPNCAEWTIAQLATARIGLILVNINPAYRTSELAFALEKADVAALVCAARFKTSDYITMVETVLPETCGSAPGSISSAALPRLRTLIKIGGERRQGWFDFQEIESRGQIGDVCIEETAAALDCHDPINIQFTSGTTGLPKGATLSHHSILNNGYFVGLAMGLGIGDRLCIPVPLYHCFGMVMSNLACMIHGATMVYPSDVFDAGAVLKTIQEERCTALHGVPTMFIAELAHPDFDRFDLSSLRTGLMAGSPCPIEVMKQVVERMHMRDVGIAYGMTETSPVSFQTSIIDPLERRVSTVGRVQPHLEIKLVDENGAIVPRGVPGELCTRGYSVMLGYWGDETKTREVLDADGWMHTGDLATIDSEGFGSIVGRIKDMVIRGGENIYPREIEEFLITHPLIEDVQVIGVPDEKFGEELCAWVKCKQGNYLAMADINSYCQGKIARFKIPKYVRFVDSFPMTVTGKVQKHAMRSAMLLELNCDNSSTGLDRSLQTRV